MLCAVVKVVVVSKSMKSDEKVNVLVEENPPKQREEHKERMNVIFEMTHLQHAQQFLLRRFFPAQLQQFPAELLGLGRLFRARHYV